MKQPKTTFLPNSKADKLVAIFGYFVAFFGVILAFSYATAINSTCIADNKTALFRFSIIISLIHLVISIGVALLARGLTRHTSVLYNIIAIVVPLFVLIAQLIFAVGYAFAVGTACTT